METPNEREPLDAEHGHDEAVDRLLEPEYLTVPEEHVGLELDEFLCLLYPQVPKGRLRHEVRTGRVLVDGERVQPSVRLRSSQVLIVSIDEELLDRPLPTAPDVEVAVLYEDDRLCCVDKPAGIAVEPERWFRDAATLSGALLARAKRGDREPQDDAPALEHRPRLVHRLDKETSGVLLVAKDLEAERALRRAFEHGRVGKRYLALVEGEHPLADGERDVVDLPVGPDRRRTGRMRVCDDGKPATTELEVVERFHGYTLMACFPRTGRTHQIRVHLAAQGFPLAADRLYGRRDSLCLSDFKRGYKPKPGRPERPLLDRLSLHAAELRFALPEGRDDLGAAAEALPPGDEAFEPGDGRVARTADGRWLRVRAQLHPDFERALKQLRKHRPFRSRGRTGGRD